MAAVAPPTLVLGQNVSYFLDSLRITSLKKKLKYNQNKLICNNDKYKISYIYDKVVRFRNIMGWETQLFHYPMYMEFKIVKNHIINVLKQVKNIFTLQNQIPLYLYTILINK